MRSAVAALLWCCVLISAGLADPPVAYKLNDGRYLIKDELFVSIVDADTHCPQLCCYTVTRDSLTGAGAQRNFKTLVKDASLLASDYAGSGYDIGHLAPLGSFDADPEADDVNYLENCAPQRPALNRGPWLALENRERELALEFGRVDVSCGALFEKSEPPLKNARRAHRVPSAFWKRIAWSAGEEWYLFPQECGRSDPLEQFRISQR